MPTPSPAPNPSARQTLDQKERRKLSVSRVYTFAERARGFRSERAKIYALIRLGNLLWKEDSQYARKLFLQALDSLKSVKADVARNDASPVAKQIVSRGEYAYLRGTILSYMAKHDPVLAKRLADAEMKDDTEADRVTSNLSTAMNLISTSDDLPTAADFAQRSLEKGVPPLFIQFLFQLRRKEPKLANQLFIAALNRLAATPNVNGKDFMNLGAYLYTSPDGEEGIAVAPVGGMVVVNLTSERPDIPPALTRAYMEAAAQILGRQVADPLQQKLYYVAAYQLIPKARSFAPDLLPPLAASLTSRSHDVPEAITRNETYAGLAVQRKRDDNPTLEDVIQEIDQVEDPAQRNVRRVRAAKSLYEAGDYARARAIVEKITDAEARAKSLNLIEFGEAAGKLQIGEVSIAEEKAGKLNPGIERALLLLAVADAQLKGGDKTRAWESLNSAIKEARRLDGIEGAHVFLKAASALSRIDAVSAMQTLSEAVKAFNASEPRISRWTQTVVIAERKVDFSLKGLEGKKDFSAVHQLVEVDAEETVSRVLHLEHEEQLGDALVALSEKLLLKNS
jgi:tetratricopeptide (TPR) repeat protein